MYLLLVRRGGRYHAQRTHTREGIEIRVGFDRDRAGFAVEVTAESRVDLRITGYIDIRTTRLALDRIRCGERDRTFLVRIELLAVELASAARYTAAVNQVQRVFLVYLVVRILVDIDRIIIGYRFCHRRRQQLAGIVAQKIVSVVGIGIAGMREARTVECPTYRTLYPEEHIVIAYIYRHLRKIIYLGFREVLYQHRAAVAIHAQLRRLNTCAA